MTTKRIYQAILIIVTLVAFNACKVTVSLSGASISPDVKTYTIAYIPNNAAMVAPLLSTSLREGLQDKFSRQTSLTNRTEGGDMSFEGEITGYTTAPTSVSGEDNMASMYRLSVSVKMKFTNVVDTEQNFDRVFTAYADYPATTPLQTVENKLIADIVEILAEDMFNAATSNW